MMKRMTAIILAALLLVTMLPILEIPVKASSDSYYDEFGVTYNQLFTLYPEYLHSYVENQVTNVAIKQYTSVLEGHKDSDDYIPVLVTAIKEDLGFSVAIREILAGFGLSESTEKQMLLDTTTLLLNNISHNETTVSILVSEAEKNFSVLDGFYDLTTAAGKSGFIKGLQSVCKWIPDDQIDTIAEAVFAEDIDKLFKNVDKAIEFCDVLITFFAMQEIETGIVKIMIDSVPQNCGLREALNLYLEERGTAAAFMDTYFNDKIIEKVSDKLLETVTSVSVPVKVAAEVLSFCADVLYQGPDATDIYAATTLSGYVQGLYSAVATKRVEFCQTTLVGMDEIAEYQALFSAYIEAIRTTLESTKPLASEEQQGYIDDAISFCGRLTYDNYIRLCMTDLKADIDAGVVAAPGSATGNAAACIKEMYPSYGTIVITKNNANIMDRPCSVNTDAAAQKIESGALNAEYTVTGLYLNTAGNYWYEIITSSGSAGYIYSENCAVKDAFGDVSLSGLSVPTSLSVGDRFWLEGTVSAQYVDLTHVSFIVMDMAGNSRTGGTVAVDGNAYTLNGSDLDTMTEFNILEAGTYKCEVRAVSTNYITYLGEGELDHFGVLHTSYFTVGNTNSASGKTAEQIRQQISSTYSQALSASGLGSFDGWCGAFVGQQLSILGINTAYCAPNGCDSFDQYKNMSYSTGGYAIKAYPATAYTITSSLNALSNNGTIPVYNIMVGFQYGYLGNEYGHVCFIHAIIDGTVYYSESFSENLAGAEGTVIACSVDEFSNFYTRNGYVFEGTIHFQNTVCTHSYAVSVVQATCTETGRMVYTCSLCGESYSEEIAALGHSYGAWVTDVAATCTQPGTEKKTCAGCGDVISQEVAATGHSYIAEQMDAVCEDYPKTRYSCQACGDFYDEYGDSIYSEWVTELPDNVDVSTVQSKTQYRYQTMHTATSTESIMDGWTLLDTVYGEWGTSQTTTNKPAESDTLRITATAQTGWGYHHWCNYYYNGGNNWNIDSIACGSSSAWHGYTSSVELPAISFQDQGGQQAYGGYYEGTNALACPYNFYIWFRNPSADVYTYTFQTRQLLNRFYKWSDWSEWSKVAAEENEQTNVEKRTLYRYIVAEKGEHQYERVETAPTFTQKGSVTYTCDMCDDVIVEEIPCLTGNVKQWNVVLDSDMEINFHFDVSQRIESTAKVRISVGSDAFSYDVSRLEKNADGLYIASVNISAAQLNDPIMVVVMNGSQIGSMNTYTVRQYADTVLADESYSQYHALIREMLAYGGAAQTYFGYGTESLASDGITDAGASEIPTQTEEFSVSGSAEDVSFYAASLLYRDKVAVRFYFRVAGDINAYSFTAGETAYTPVLKDGLYYIEIAGITPENLDQQVQVTVTDGNGNAMTVSYGPMNYIVRMNEKGSDSLKALLKALYNYHLAAKALRTAEV